jgi:hypothetical protein
LLGQRTRADLSLSALKSSLLLCRAERAQLSAALHKAGKVLSLNALLARSGLHGLPVPLIEKVGGSLSVRHALLPS